MAKKASRKLFNLIKSLTGSEKRYFKVYIKHWSAKNSKYLELFEAIEVQESFDDKAIQEMLYGEAATTSRKFSELKSYLFLQILNALQDYDEKKSVSLQLNNYLLNIAVLYRRSLFDAIPEQINKAKKLAVMYEEFESLLVLNDWEMKILEHGVNTKFIAEKQYEIESERASFFQKYNNVISYRNLFFNCYAIVKQDALARVEAMRLRLEEIMNDPLMASVDMAISVTGRLLYFRILGFYLYTKRKWQDYYENNKRIISLIESSFFQQDIAEYISNLSNYSQSCTILKKYDEAQEVLGKLYALPCETEDDKWKQHRQYFLNNFSILMTLGKFEEGIKWIEKHEKEKQIFPESYFKVGVFYYDYFCIYFGAGKMREALSVLNDWREVPAKVARPDLQSLVQILFLIVYYESDHLYYDNLLRNANRFLKRSNRFYSFEKLFSKHLSKAYKTPGSAGKKAVFEELKIALLRVKDQESVIIMLGMFNFIAWIDSKITGRNYGDIIREGE